ncbi:unnamed protein product [Caenorhabditis angaria]|uniref:RING-type domain-containing protein n=1 Tax=Caenorhabditis angaria TaxID=860376 RepID=A0A9P1J2J8_9PELO|nr:unnamed protein product [Caenorhabditis angaria]
MGLGPSKYEYDRNITWVKFLSAVQEMNRNYRHVLIDNNEYLCFAMARTDLLSADSEEDWRQLIRIVCCKVNIETKAVVSCKKLTLREFLTAHELHLVMMNNKPKLSPDPMTTSQFILDQTSDIEGNCVICMENVNDILLPCLHSFCLRCVIAESEYRGRNFSCPMCKMPIENPIESAWEVTDPPEQSEIDDYLKGIVN